MEDIYDIKEVFIGFPIDLTYSLLFIVFIIILFIFYTFLNPSTKNSIETPQVIKKEKRDFNFILLDFEEKYLDLSLNEFYAKLLDILRVLLEEKGNKNISKMTFEEINKLDLDISLKNLIKSMYYKEYVKTIDDNKDIRLDFIKKIRKLIK